MFDAVQLLATQHPEGAARKDIAAALAQGEVDVQAAALTACLSHHERMGVLYVEPDTALYQTAF